MTRRTLKADGTTALTSFCYLGDGVAAEAPRQELTELEERNRQMRADTLVNDTEQRRKRQSAVNHARASVGLEGFKPPEACEQQAARFTAGEIDLAEFVKPAR